MQVIFWPDIWTVLLIVVLWPAFQMGAAEASRRLPDRFFDYSRGIYHNRPWEKNGAVYDSWFKIRRWKHLLPDGGAIVPGGYAKKHLTDYSPDNLVKFLNESCRAELSHWLAILPFWLFGLIGPPSIILFMFLYALLINGPCILAQRFNRPRIARVLSSLSNRG
jgi:glycosyl-4,4'-diaponeurosporenoate acyltransferase